MATSPLPTRSAASIRAGRELLTRTAGLRRRARVGDLARRRHLIILAKWILPAAALALLSIIAAWPEVEQIEAGVRVATSNLRADVTAARVTDAQYHSVDASGRPYTVTATLAQQDGPERVNLTAPKGDITLQNGTWLMVKARQGVFIQHRNLLDLSHDVTLYRDDGTTLVTQSASLDLTRGAAAGAEPVHAEGPFGTLDAQGFTATDKGTSIEFAGPARMVLNGATAGGATAGGSTPVSATSGGMPRADMTLGGATPGSASSVGAAPVNPTPGNATSGNTTSGNATLGSPTPGTATSDNAASGNTTSGTATPDHATSDGRTPGNVTPGNVTPGNVTLDNATSGIATSGNTNSGNTASGDATSDSAISGDTASGNTTSVSPTLGNVTPGSSTSGGPTWGGGTLSGSTLGGTK